MATSQTGIPFSLGDPLDSFARPFTAWELLAALSALKPVLALPLAIVITQMA
jgi:hypothetical protein